jgi:hypothetical protein
MPETISQALRKKHLLHELLQTNTKIDMKDTGWIKLHRSILEWEWFSDHNVFRLFTFLLISVNYEEKKWRGFTVSPGELVTSLESLSKKTGLSVQSIRTSLNKLISTGELTNKNYSKFRVITINNFDKYQESTSNITSSQQATNKQLTTTKEYKERKNIRSISLDAFASRKHDFETEVNTFLNQYPKETIVEFLNYWTEPNRSKTRMRCELEKTWSTGLRLKTWANRTKVNGSFKEKTNGSTNPKFQTKISL